MPASVVERARVVLDQLEKGDREGGKRQLALIDDLPLFSAVPPAPAPAPASRPDALTQKLAGVFPDELTPRDALSLVYELKKLSGEAS